MAEKGSNNSGCVANRTRLELYNIGVPLEDMTGLELLPSEVRGVVLYGSRARGDHLPDSDIDLLAILERPCTSITTEPLSISFYTTQQLQSAKGTLFGSHLKRDGVVLWDSDGHLQGVLDSLGDVEVARLFDRARQASALFAAPEIDLPQYLPGLLREARYLLRSCLYAESIRESDPCFSVRELAKRYQDDRLVGLLASRHRAPATVEEYDECLRRLSRLIGGISQSKHGSLEATIVNEWGTGSDLLAMAFLALGTWGGGDYAEVDKVLL